MKWEMEMEEVEAVLEKIWDLHDKISDAIHSISRNHFLKTVKNLGGKCSQPDKDRHNTTDGEKNGFVYVKGIGGGEGEDDCVVMAEARSLNSIRSALENLEDQLEFFHTVQTQQRAERDAALARLEQSRIILAMRLADHQGKKYEVLEEASAFVGNVNDAGRFVTPENLYESANQSCETLDPGGRIGFLAKMLFSSLAMAKSSLGLQKIGGVLGNASIFAVSMLALVQLQQVAFKGETPHLHGQVCYWKRQEKNDPQREFSSRIQMKELDVLSARG